MSKQVKVISIEEGGGDLVPSDKIETTINQMISQGWSFLQLSTGGVSYAFSDDSSSMVITWVYLLFERS
jgi:hypothetical protein